MAKNSVKAKIRDIEVNLNQKKAIIAVELDDGKTQWNKAIGVELVDYTIPFDDFKAKLATMVQEDLIADRALAEIYKRKGMAFNLLDIDKA